MSTRSKGKRAVAADLSSRSFNDDSNAISAQTRITSLLARLDALLLDECKIITEHVKELATWIQGAWTRLKNFESDIKVQEGTLERLHDTSANVAIIVDRRLIALSKAIETVEAMAKGEDSIPLEELRGPVRAVFDAAVNISKLYPRLKPLIKSNSLSETINELVESRSDDLRVPQIETLASLWDLPAPKSDDYLNFGLELIGGVTRSAKPQRFVNPSFTFDPYPPFSLNMQATSEEHRDKRMRTSETVSLGGASPGENPIHDSYHEIRIPSIPMSPWSSSLPQTTQQEEPLLYNESIIPVPSAFNAEYSSIDAQPSYRTPVLYDFGHGGSSTGTDYMGGQLPRRGDSRPQLLTPLSPILSPTMSPLITTGRAAYGDRPESVASSPLNSQRWSEDTSSQDGSASGQRRHTFRRTEEPPRNAEGKFVCKYPECGDLTFDRRVEWSKHMDKHDRPYKCLVKGCEKLQGYTYSGGLLRHEREVHRMHGGARKSLFCPFTDCKRSSGSGFTRKENLAEHIRRVHRRTNLLQDTTPDDALAQAQGLDELQQRDENENLFCPFTDCTGSIGTGFTKEKLAEHVRRVHRQTDVTSDILPDIVLHENRDSDEVQQGKKGEFQVYCPVEDCDRSYGSGFSDVHEIVEHFRREHAGRPLHGTGKSPSQGQSATKELDSEEDDSDANLKKHKMKIKLEPDDSEDSLYAELKRLRTEAAQKDARLQALEVAVKQTKVENEEKDARLRQLEKAVNTLLENKRTT